MRTLITILLLSPFYSICAYAVQSLSQDIRLFVFTTQHYPITDMRSYPSTLYYINAVGNLEQSPIFQLSGSSQQAEQQVRALIQSLCNEGYI